MQVRPLSSRCHLKTFLSLCPYKELCFEGYFVTKVIFPPSLSLCLYKYMYKYVCTDIKTFTIKNSFSNIILPLEEINTFLSHCTFQYNLNITKEEKILRKILLHSILGGCGVCVILIKYTLLSSLLEIKHCLKILRMCRSLSSDMPAFPPALHAEHDAMPYGISLWPLGVICPS